MQTKQLLLSALLLFFLGGIGLLIWAINSVSTSGPTSSASTAKPSSASRSIYDSDSQDSSAPSSLSQASAPASIVSNPSVPQNNAQAPVTHLPVSPVAHGGFFQMQTKARIKLNGTVQALLPNQLGDFPRVGVDAKQVIPITVAYKDGNPGDPVMVQVQDGGALAGGSMVQEAQLDDNGDISFDFKAGTQDGIYRITLVKANEQQTLNFWVGPAQQHQE
jgi:hypothetical protein